VQHVAIELARRVVAREQVAIRKQVVGQRVERRFAVRDETKPFVVAQRVGERARQGR